MTAIDNPVREGAMFAADSRSVGAGWASLNPAMAISLAEPGLRGAKVIVTPVEKVGYWRRQYRRYGYPAPYALTNVCLRGR